MTEHCNNNETLCKELPFNFGFHGDMKGCSSNKWVLWQINLWQTYFTLPDADFFFLLMACQIVMLFIFLRVEESMILSEILITPTSFYLVYIKCSTLVRKLKLISVCTWPLTWFLKLFVKDPPRLCDPFQALLHSLNVHIGAVALRKFGVTVAPAVIFFAHKLTLPIAGYIAQSSQHKTLSQVVW